jgi:hypothetical protein
LFSIERKWCVTTHPTKTKASLQCLDVEMQRRIVSVQYGIAASLFGLFDTLFPAEAAPEVPAGFL